MRRKGSFMKTDKELAAKSRAGRNVLAKKLIASLLSADALQNAVDETLGEWNQGDGSYEKLQEIEATLLALFNENIDLDLEVKNGKVYVGIFGHESCDVHIKLGLKTLVDRYVHLGEDPYPSYKPSLKAIAQAFRK